MTGSTTGTGAVFGVGDPSQQAIAAAGSDDMFLARFDLVNSRFVTVERR